MKRRLTTLSALATCVSASAVMAAPCVGTTFDLPFEGALDVQSYVVDVPSAQYPAFWQKGSLGDYAYVLYANGEATLRSRNPFEEWGVTVLCDAATQTCETSTNGTPPADTDAIANRLTACLLGNATPPVAPQPVTVPALPDPAPVRRDPVPCGLAAVDEETDIATLQRLLTLAGKDPGPVDGFLGTKTFQAMGDFVEDAGWGTSIPDAIASVDAVLCQTDD